MGRETKKTQGAAYAASGVDIDAASRTVELIKRKARATFRSEVLTDIGAFAGLFQLSGYKEPVLVSSVDGVGTKVKIAIALDRHDTIGIDLVNHCVNDIFTCGAEPLFFLDYIAMGKLVPDQVESVVSGLSRACSDVGCALIGGETAEMPGLYASGDYDLVGFMVGVVERGNILDNRSIQAGDAILELPSSGLHTNGYSLVRKTFNVERSTLNTFYPELGRTLGEELLEPHRCYYPKLKRLLPRIKGMAHITGGGLIDNLPRILPDGLCARIEAGSWSIPPIFALIQQRGGVDQREMYRVFNMGIGMVLVCSPGHVEEVIASAPEARLIGEVTEGRGKERVIVS
ncbi:MAG: phosphoribosylformylglycinamidine cyclo-ligase [Dehalococcoidia bacterium]|nr:MAG: phosphoribosylformylglycinamidine cyclo-ligase [Dehalococcoidia bacterium]